MRGKVMLMSPPSSEVKVSLDSEASFNNPMDPLAETFKVSAPPKTLRVITEALKAVPTCWMLEWVTSKFRFSDYLGFAAK